MVCDLHICKDCLIFRLCFIAWSLTQNMLEIHYIVVKSTSLSKSFIR